MSPLNLKAYLSIIFKTLFGLNTLDRSLKFASSLSKTKEKIEFF